MRNAPNRRDDGSVTLLTLGFAVIAIALVLVVAAATQVHIDRLRLMRVADEVALDAADFLDAEAYYGGEGSTAGPGAVLLDSAAIERRATDRVVAAARRAGLPETALADVESRDGATVTVTVRTVVHPLFGIDALIPFANGITLTATSSARAE